MSIDPYERTLFGNVPKVNFIERYQVTLSYMFSVMLRQKLLPTSISFIIDSVSKRNIKLFFSFSEISFLKYGSKCYGIQIIEKKWNF